MVELRNQNEQTVDICTVDNINIFSISLIQRLDPALKFCKFNVFGKERLHLHSQTVTFRISP